MRRLLSRAALLAGATCLGLGAFLSTLSESTFDAVTFGDRAAASLSDERVASFAADRITDTVIHQNPDLTAVRPLILGVAEGLAGSQSLRGVVRAAARSAHQAFFADETRQVVLSAPDVGILLRSVFEKANPALAEQIPEEFRSAAASFEVAGGTQLVVDLWKLRSEALWLVRLLLISGPMLLALGAALALDRRHGLVAAGGMLFGTGLLVAAARPVGGLAVAQLTAGSGAEGALAGLWDTCMSALTSWGLLLGGLGLLFVSAGTSLLEGFDPLRWARRAGRVIAAPPASPRGRLGWGAGVLAAGMIMLTSPRLVLEAATVLGGSIAALVGTRELFRLLLESVEDNPALARAGATRRQLLRTSLVAGVAVVIATTWLALRNPLQIPAPSSVVTCNGQAAFCGRRLDELVFAGAHNAMSNAEIRDWMFPHHERAIPQQLVDGVRALLIDVHPGFPGASRIKTDLSGNRPTQEALEHALGQEGLDAALRIRERLVGADEGQRGLYLCHGFCEVGAYELTPTLADIRSFLLQSPGEVLILVIEDYVSPEDLAEAFREGGLAERVYKGDSGPPWPKLRKLVAGGENVIVFLESGRSGVPWLRPAFELIQETPYTFREPGDFSCRPNRGGAAGSLLQINHWIETTPAPRPSNAQSVNAHDFLLDRARQCERERGMLPNVLAVDFYRTGDLLGVVDELNTK
jgi:hypothetical protein